MIYPPLSITSAQIFSGVRPQFAYKNQTGKDIRITQE